MVELAVQLGILGGLLAAGVGAATSAPDSPLLWFVEACCLYAVGLIVILELRPRVLALRARNTALRYFREQLAQLPDVSHPLDQAARPTQTHRVDQPIISPRRPLDTRPTNQRRRRVRTYRH